MRKTCCGIEADAEAPAGGVGAVEIGLRPVVGLAGQLDIGIAGFGYFGEAIFKRQAAEDRPEHDGEREWRLRDAVEGSAIPGLKIETRGTQQFWRCGCADRGGGEELGEGAAIHAPQSYSMRAGTRKSRLPEFVRGAGLQRRC